MKPCSKGAGATITRFARLLLAAVSVLGVGLVQAQTPTITFTGSFNNQITGPPGTIDGNPSGSTANLTVTGNRVVPSPTIVPSPVTVTANILSVGVVANGTLNIQNGANLTNTGANGVAIGAENNFTGTVIVDGLGSNGMPSTWTINTILAVGAFGTGKLTISDGALVSTGAVSGGITTVASASGSTGTINVTSGGTLQTLALGAGSGTPHVNFDGGILRAIANRNTSTTFFISGFSGKELNIKSGGLTIDDAGFTVGTDTSSVFSGTGVLTKTGSGTVILRGNNTYKGTDSSFATIIEKGTLQLGSGGTTGRVEGNILDNGVLAISRSGAVPQNRVIVGGLVSGSGSLDQLGPGTLVLGAGNTYTGKTIISGGILSIASAADLGDSTGLTFNGGTLRTTSNITTGIPVIMAKNSSINKGGNTDTFSGQFTGSGALTSTGSGTLILTGNNTNFSGGVTVLNGTLAAGRAAPIVENPTDSFSTALGTGNVSVLGGTLRTTSFLTGQPLAISVGGNYSQASSGKLALGIGGLQGEQYDRLVVGRSAVLDATLVVTSLNGFHPSNGDAFEVLRTAGTVSGNFVLNDSAFNSTNGLTGQLRLIPVELVAPNGVLLVYLESTTPEEPIEIVPDPLPPVDPEAPILDSEVLKLINFTAAQLTSLYEITFSGANTQRFSLDSRMLQLQQSIIPVPQVQAPPPTTKEYTKEAPGKEEVPSPAYQPGLRWGIWGNGYGDWVNLDGTDLAKGYQFTTGGMSAGIDYLITDRLAVGVFGGYSHTWTGLRPGSIDVDTGRGGLYATYFNQGWWVNAAIWGGGNSYSTSRQALEGSANGDTSGWEMSTFGEAGYNFHLAALTIGPTVALQFTRVGYDGFTEHGSLVPLNVHSGNQNSLRSDVGIQGTYTLPVGKITLIPYFRAAWEREYKYTDLPISFGASDFPGVTATLNGPKEGRDSAIVNAGVGVQWTQRISTFIQYQGVLGRSNYDSNGVNGGISFSF